MRYPLWGLALCFAGPLIAQPLTEQLSVRDLNFRFAYVAWGIESPCGADGYAHDAGYQVCFRRVAGGDRLEVLRAAPLPDLLSGLQVIRGPVAGDRRILWTQNPLSISTPVYAHDPVTNGVAQIGVLPGGFGSGQVRGLLDFDADGVQELLTTDGFDTRIISLPGAPGGAFQVLATVSTAPWQQSVPFLAQIDADPQTELAGAPGGQLRFLDPRTQTVEAFAPGVPLVSAVYVGDWDADGVDELAQPAAGGFALVDPNRVPAVYASAPTSLTASVDLLARVDWTGTASHQIATRSRFGIKVLDPRSGALLADYPQDDLRAARVLRAQDWDGDGDGDLALLRADAALLLLRNPEGPELLQRGAGPKRPLGLLSTPQGAELVSLEMFGTEPVHGMLRRRNAQTLAVVGEADTGPQESAYMRAALGDFHPLPGAEVLIGSSRTLRAYRVSDGSLLWERVQPTASTREFGDFALPDGECSGTTTPCQRIVVAEGPRPGSGDTLSHRPILLDGADGQDVWVGPPSDCPGCRNGAVAYTDLDGDGDREVLHSTQSLQGGEVRALDGVSPTPLWQSTLPLELVQLVRTSDPVRRLAGIDTTRTLTVLDPLSGAVVRSRSIDPSTGAPRCLLRCELNYLPQGRGAGLWLIWDGDSGALSLVRRDLRGEVQNAFPGGEGAQALDRDALASGSQIGLTRYGVDQDALFTDEFERW